MATGEILSIQPLWVRCKACGVEYSPVIKIGGGFSKKCPLGCIKRRDGTIVHCNGKEYTSRELLDQRAM